MRFTRTIDAAVVAAAIAMLPSAASAQASKTDVTGKWSFTVESPAGTGTPTVSFAQKGDTISGRYISQALGDHEFTGTLKDGKIRFSFNAESGGQAFVMAFDGALDGADAMKGSIDFSGMATGSFAGRRQKP